MGKVKTAYVCQQCGASSAKWLGKCPDCDSWNSLVEEKAEPSASERPRSLGSRARPQDYREVDTGDEIRIGSFIIHCNKSGFFRKPIRMWSENGSTDRSGTASRPHT